MHSHRPFLTQHRFQRLVLWTLVLLQWIAAMLVSNRAVTLRHVQQRGDMICLPWLTRLVGKLLIVRAGQLARLRRRRRIRLWRRGCDLRRAHLIRSALGARLRRKMKHKDPRARIAGLIAIVRDLDGHAAPLAKRLRRGLTRLWRTWAPITAVCTDHGAPAPAPAFSDSS